MVLPRQIAVFLMRERTASSFKDIGSFLRKHHSTILYAHEKIKEQQDENHQDLSQLNNLINQISL